MDQPSAPAGDASAPQEIFVLTCRQSLHLLRRTNCTTIKTLSIIPWFARERKTEWQRARERACQLSSEQEETPERVYAAMWSARVSTKHVNIREACSGDLNTENVQFKTYSRGAEEISPQSRSDPGSYDENSGTGALARACVCVYVCACVRACACVCVEQSALCRCSRDPTALALTPHERVARVSR